MTYNIIIIIPYIIIHGNDRNQVKAVIFVKSLWLEKDEPRKHFFKAAYPFVSSIAFDVQHNRMEDLYEMYERYIRAYKKLDILLRLYDQEVVATFDGIEAAISIYCPCDKRFDEIFVSA